jgi:hypothetical protein
MEKLRKYGYFTVEHDPSYGTRKVWIVFQALSNLAALEIARRADPALGPATVKVQIGEDWISIADSELIAKSSI